MAQHKLVLTLCLSSVVGACSASSTPPKRDGGLGGSENTGSMQTDAGDGDGADGSQKPGDAGEDGAAAPPGCGMMSVKLSTVAPRVMIVLDRSGSMNADGNPQMTDRWTGSVDAVQSVTRQHDNDIAFGLLTFPTENACDVGSPAVQVGPRRAPDIEKALIGLTASGGTPTEDALLSAKAALTTSGNAQSSPAHVLLVTDGAPTCRGTGRPLPVECAPPNEGSPECFAQPGWGRETSPELVSQAVAAVTDLAAAGIKTHVIGFQTAGTDTAGILDQLAAAGATGLSQHRSVASGAELETLLKSVAESAVACVFTLEEAMPQGATLSLSLNGKAIAEASQWSLAADRQTVTLLSTACATVQSGAPYTLTADVTCP